MPGRLRTARPRAQLRQGRNDWYRITNAIGTGPAQIHIYDEIGYWGITASDFIRELSSLNATTIDLHINSPGGEIFDGIAIMNALRSHPATVTTYVDSLAASIASVIAMAGDRVVMAPRSQLMIHDGSGLCIGNAADMRKTAELLDRQSDNIAAVYAERAGGTVEEWRARMTVETWYTAAEAVEAGLADEISSSQSPADDNSPNNLWDLSIFAYAGRAEAPPPVPVATAPAALVAEQVEPTEAPAVDPGPVEVEAPIVAHANVEPDVPIDDPAPADQADDWASITARLINPAPSTEDAFARLREAFL
jgi:ATP-dependent protease ClpP protease subunit